MRSALADADTRNRAVERYIAKAVDPKRPEMAEQLRVSAARALALFAGSERAKADATTLGGWQAIAEFMEANVPEAERNRAGEVLVRILNGALFELAQMTREQAGLKPMAQDEKTLAFMSQMVLSLSDAHFYPAPMAFELKDFTQVQASVFQVARAPGKTLVYLGAVSLILGVFMMLYVRDRRLWVWLQDLPGEPGRTRVSTALSSTRRTLDGDAEFDRLRAALLKEKTV